MKFRLDRTEDTIRLHGTDDEDGPFSLTLPKVWAMNLASEIDDWLSAAQVPKYEPLRVVECVGCHATGLIGDKSCPLCRGQGVRRA